MKRLSMNNRRDQKLFNLPRSIKKLFLSAFVVFTFIAYALHKPSANADSSLSAVAPTPDAQATQTLVAPPETDPAAASAPPQPEGSPTAALQATATAPQQPAAPTQPPPATATAVKPATGGLYKDGSYTGPEVDAFYGLVQVKVVVQNGKIANVQFLEYPNDRRTSVRINTIVMPYLQQEAIQAQNANVDIISGATLTSEAFMTSLQSALNKARG